MYFFRLSFSFFLIFSSFFKYFIFFLRWISFILYSSLFWFIYIFILLSILFLILSFFLFSWNLSTLLPNDLLLDISFLISSVSKLYSPGPGCFSLFLFNKFSMYTEFSLFIFCCDGKFKWIEFLIFFSYLFLSLK